MIDDRTGEFESRLRRQSPAGPPDELRARVLARASVQAPGTAGGSKRRGLAPWLAVAAGVVVAVAAGINSLIESRSDPGSARQAAAPVMATIPSPMPELAGIAVIRSCSVATVNWDAVLKERAQLEALIGS
jgi:hypothetical protein